LVSFNSDSCLKVARSQGSFFSEALSFKNVPNYSTEPSLKVQDSDLARVSVQGVKSLGGHFACLCRGFEFYEVKKKIVIIFQKENGNTFTLLIIFIVKSLQKEQNSTNLLL
jgi:hypothetical protein